MGDLREEDKADYSNLQVITEVGNLIVRLR